MTQTAYAFSDWGEAHPTVDVYEAEKSPTFTGLYAPDGTKIYRRPETVPFGFRGKDGQ